MQAVLRTPWALVSSALVFSEVNIQPQVHTCNSSSWKAKEDRIEFKVIGWECGVVVRCLCSTHEAPELSPYQRESHTEDDIVNLRSAWAT